VQEGQAASKRATRANIPGWRESRVGGAGDPGAAYGAPYPVAPSPRAGERVAAVHQRRGAPTLRCPAARVDPGERRSALPVVRGCIAGVALCPAATLLVA